MKVYKLSAEGKAEPPKWVWFFTKQKGLPWPRAFEDARAFFIEHQRIEIVRNDESAPQQAHTRFGDCSNIDYDGRYPLFSERARDIFEPKLDGLGRWIELTFDEAKYWLFFTTNVVDALDETKSELIYFKSSGRLMEIAAYAFKPEAVKDQFLFTLKQQPGRDVLVTDAFVEVVRKHRLTGFMFLRLWSSESGPEPSDVKDWLKPRFTGLEPAEMLEV
jgi:hypothetical protein